MKDFKKRIENISTPVESKWRENAKQRRSNKWLTYSGEIAKRILSVLENRDDLNQSKLAEALNVTPQQISKIVKGQENMTLETIYKLSQALNCELIIFPTYKWNLVELGSQNQISIRSELKLNLPFSQIQPEPVLQMGNFNRSKVASPTMYVAHLASNVETTTVANKIKTGS